jgi:hypothetical protein
METAERSADRLIEPAYPPACLFGYVPVHLRVSRPAWPSCLSSLFAGGLMCFTSLRFPKFLVSVRFTEQLLINSRSQTFQLHDLTPIKLRKKLA